MNRNNSPDRDMWLVFDAGSWDDAGYRFYSENEAYEFWMVDQDRQVIHMNPVEGWSHYVTDDFGERYTAENTRAPARQRMVRCPSAHHARAS